MKDKIKEIINKVKIKVSGILKHQEIVDYTLYDTKFFKEELKKLEDKERSLNIIKKALCSLIVIFAVAIIISNFVITVYQISDSSMTPTYKNEDVLVLLRTSNIKENDVIAFYKGNDILIRRVIAKEGSYVVIDSSFDVYVDGNKLKEIYVSKKDLGSASITFPYEVPVDTVFVLSDDRESLIDSRNKEFGCVKKEEIIGKVLFKIWPIGG